MTLDSGLEPMPDEVAIQALRVAHRPRRPRPLHHRRRGLEPTGHRVSHPGGTAHRGRPAANRRDSDSSSMLKTEFREALRDCEPTRRRDLLVDHVTAQVAAAMGLASPQLLDPSAGFFQSGMDSLMSVTLQRSLVGKPRRGAARVCRVRLSDRRGARRLPGHNSSRAGRGCRSGECRRLRRPHRR